MPPKSKSKNAPNQHDKRHESGLAAPGKRVTKQRSNGQLNGQPNGKPSPSATPVPASPPPTGLNQAFHFPRSGHHASVPDAPVTTVQDHVGPLDGAEREGLSSDVSLEDIGPRGEMGDSLHHPHAHEQAAPATPSLSVEAPAPAYRTPPSAQHLSTTSAVSTILTNYPLRDAIAILILLLSLPPTLVLVIQTLFASLTFVPPTAGLSFSTFPNIKELFNSSGLGYPALATILIVDLIFWVCWLPVWTPLQGVFLDLSQAVIAVSLSGAAAGNGRPTYSIATTSAIVCVVHVLRYKAVHLTALDYLRSVIHKAGGGLPVDVFSIAANYFSPSYTERGWAHTVIRTILGIHIVSQGVTTCIRRSLVRANEQSANVPAIIRSDPEATAGPDTPRSTAALSDAAQLLGSSSGPDGRFLAPSPAHRDAKRDSTSKKKRKQANQVRSQQPLWAAIASTKVTFVKEMEQKDAVDDAREASHMGMHSSSSPGSKATSCLWIREVRDTEILFTVQLCPDAQAEGAKNGEEGVSIGPGIDKSKPFYVCINGAAWSSTRITPAGDESDGYGGKTDRYDGEIFGLAPLSSYHCELVGLTSKRCLCEASVITQPAPSAEPAAASTLSQPAHPTLRPSSPITTLKQSILSAEAKLQEARNRGKKSKKDQRAVHSDIKREINMLRAKLESSGGTDERQERRLLQISQHKNQAEEATAELKEQMDSVGEVPDNEITEAEHLRHVWEQVLMARDSALKELEAAKAEADRELSTLQSDIFHAESKREKLMARHAQRTQDVERLVSKQHADLTAKQKRDFERAHLLQLREHEESQLRFHIQGFDAESHAYQQKAHDAYQQIASMQSWPPSSPAQAHLGQPPPYPGYSSPPTPETQSASVVANGSSSSTTAAAAPNGSPFPMFAPSSPFNLSPFNPSAALAPPPLPLANGPTTAPRQRSSSMLSQYSGFTDDADDDPAPPQPPPAQHPAPPSRNHPSFSHFAPAVLDDPSLAGPERSASLGSGSTGSNSPRPDAKPFIPAGAGNGKPGVGIVVPPPPSSLSQGGGGGGWMGGRVNGGVIGGGGGGGKGEKTTPPSPLQTSASVDAN